jgi:hypothetical protein
VRITVRVINTNEQQIYMFDCTRYVDAGIAHIVRAVNFVPGVDVVDGMTNRRMDEDSLRSTLWFSLLRFSGREAKLWFEIVVSSLISHLLLVVLVKL